MITTFIPVSDPRLLKAQYAVKYVIELSVF
jgi:hypothetical protein